MQIDLGSLIGTAPEADGTYVVRASQTDKAGNVSGESELCFSVDRAAPEISFNNSAVSLNGSAAASFARNISVLGASDISIEVVDKQGKAVSVPGLAITDGVLAGDLSKIGADGTYSIKVSASDAAGNDASRSLNFTLDRAAPSFSSFAAAAGQPSAFNPNQVSAEGHTFSGTVQGLNAGKPVVVEILQTGGSGAVKLTAQPTVTDSGAFSARFAQTELQSLADGDYIVRARATDDAGNAGQSVSSIAIAVDREAPQASLTPLAKTALSLSEAQAFSQTLSVSTGSVVTAQVFVQGSQTPQGSIVGPPCPSSPRPVNGFA